MGRVSASPSFWLIVLILLAGSAIGQDANQVKTSLARYLDPVNGVTVDEAVAKTLAHDGEIQAMRAEIEAARARLRQAELRPDPKIGVERAEQMAGPDNTTRVVGMIPLEIGGRRAARIAVAARELELREALLADLERQRAADVRAKFGEALAALRRLDFIEDLLGLDQRNYTLIAARVSEGRSAPLEQSIALVEINRIRSLRETELGRVEVLLLELRNMMGMVPDEPLRLRGDLVQKDQLPAVDEAISQALNARPDLRAARVAEELAEARIEQARAEGRLGADLMAGYERMNLGFPLLGISERGGLAPLRMTSHSLIFGITFNLPVRNRNRGAIEAAIEEAEAARRRREFAELTVRREISAAYARYNSAIRALEIFRLGVRDAASANLETIRRTYELGAKTLLDYLAEQRRFIEIETGYVEALLEAYLARVEVARAINAPELISKPAK